MREGTSKQLGKAKNFCWKTGPRKAATLISISVAFYTLLAAFHNKVHNLQDFWGTFFKQGTHPRKMYELNGLRYDFVVRKKNQLDEAIKQLSDPREEYIAAVRKHGITFTNTTTPILTEYDRIVANPYSTELQAIKELYSLAQGSIAANIDGVKDKALAFVNTCNTVKTTPFTDHLKSGHDYYKKRMDFTNLPKLPSCCSSSEEEDD